MVLDGLKTTAYKYASDFKTDLKGINKETIMANARNLKANPTQAWSKGMEFAKGGDDFLINTLKTNSYTKPVLEGLVEKFPALANVAKIGTRIPIVGTLIAGAFELPSILSGFQNGDGIQQVGRSGMKVTGAVAGGVIGAGIGSIVPVVGTWIGAAIGGMAGDMIGGMVGDTVIGKSIADKQKEMPAQQQYYSSYGDSFGMYG